MCKNVAIAQLAQTELRDVLCQHTFSEILDNRRKFSEKMANKIGNRCKAWGVVLEHLQVLLHIQTK